MEIRLAVAAAAAALFGPAGAWAGIAGTAALSSDYDYRGFSQTADDPALQGSLEYARDSGPYATVWGSTLDWGQDSDADIELDWIAGYAQEIGSSGVTWDAGAVFYHYPGLGAANFLEVYGGFGWGGFSVKLSYSDDFAGVGESAFYADGGFRHEWESGWSVFLYGGYSFGNAFDEERGPAFGSPEYWNYGFGAGYAARDHLYLELKGVGTDLHARNRIDSGVFDNSFRAIASLTVAFP